MFVLSTKQCELATLTCLPFMFANQAVRYITIQLKDITLYLLNNHQSIYKISFSFFQDHYLSLLIL